MRRSAERLLPVWRGHPAEGYLLGCHAFTLEETGDYAAAEAAGRAGLALAPDDAWGLHAVAHVYDMTARAGQGLALIHSSAWRIRITHDRNRQQPTADIKGGHDGGYAAEWQFFL